MGMESGFGKPNIETKENPEEIAFPHGEEAVRLFEKEYPGNPELVEKAKEIFEIFFKQEMENIQIFKSKEGVEFPYTKINLTELAKKLYKENSKEPLKENLEKNIEHSSIEKKFIFGSFLTTRAGQAFTFTEEAIHQATMNLPRALDDLKNGQEPKDLEVYTLGSPTNLLGKMTPEFFDGLKEDSFRNMGRVYAELIRGKILVADKEKSAKISVELFGISMGAGLAAMTGEKLLETGEFTQEPQPIDKKDRKPFVQIRAEVPVTLSRSKMKKIQIPTGFIIDMIRGLGNPYTKNVVGRDKKFIEQTNAELAKRGIHENMSPEQKEMKEKSIPRLILALGKGLELKPETKVDEVYGLRDSTTWTPSLKKDAKTQEEKNPETLGSKILPRVKENSRTSVVNASHMDIPGSQFFRGSELRRIKVATEKLIELKK